MQKRDEIVLPVGTTRVDVNDIPSLIAEAMYTGCRDAGGFPPDMLIKYVDGIANAMPGRLDSELSGVELERAVKFRLTSLEKAYFTELMIAIPNGAQGKENGLKARSRRTKLLCLELKDITDAYVDIDDFRTYVTRNYPSIDVCLVDTQHQAASAKTVGATAGVEPELPWWQTKYDIFEMATNKGASLKANRESTSNTAIAKEIEKHINNIERSKATGKTSPRWDTIRGVLTGWRWKPD